MSIPEEVSDSISRAMSQMTPFEKRMYVVCDLLHAQSDLLSIIGAYKDTLSDDEVSLMLDGWIDNQLTKSERNTKKKE